MPTLLQFVLLATCRDGVPRRRSRQVMLMALASAVLSTLSTAISGARAEPPTPPSARANEDLQHTVSSKNRDLSPGGAAALIEHLLAVISKEWSLPVDAQGQLKSEEIESASIGAYREGLMEEWRLQIRVAKDTLDIVDSRKPYRIHYDRGPYVWVSPYHDPGYLAGQKDARELVRAWVDAIASEVATNKEAIIARSEHGRIDYSAAPELEALRYLRRRLPSRIAFGKASSVQSGDRALNQEKSSPH